ncbi:MULTISPECIES: DUF4199 domain-containing protein [Polaribacter]|uniref:DUF4199 domain-containing protein n=1 Tax=Polaribacter sejongensis TaxID=985043 RepID=A0AAJ1QW74_9FLAO|nr:MULTISPECIES: DUF4199 domain-containing protein [Polaribacter]AUC22622.1 DUF4199 domain-containing protein [Polaribacter sejongensis]MDN3619115.1 DUF4199 domain-containing protein [Polaribacter undariae]UWD33201.1 DUF4199 domain-containing protein [Polaribacter undariae]
MEDQANSKSLIVNYGVILAVAGILLSVITYAMGEHLKPHWSISVISIGLTTALVVLGIKKYKEINNGFISWGQGVKIGVGICILSALITAIYQYIFMTVIEPDFMQQAMEIQNQAYLDGGMTEAQIEGANEIAQKFQSPGIIAAISIIGAAILGFIISAIASAIMKKTEEETY